MLNASDVGYGDGRNTYDIKSYFNDNISIQVSISQIERYLLQN